MPETTLRVRLLGKTEKALEMIYASCRQCYSSMYAGDIFDKAVERADEGTGDFVKKVISSGHESPLEHVKFTFAVEGVSRALTHQLVRHRLASYSQQSQRYVKENDMKYIFPPSLKDDPELKEVYLDTLARIQDGYDSIIDILKNRGIEGEKANQDARFLLPQAAETKIVVTMNCRELKHFFSHRCCARAQWEIRALANRMLDICRMELPEVFETAGAKCEGLKYCPEGEKFSCGRYPVR
ncbi:MAG: FAD-dependent thymidylate synthase [Candidatus Omnitrophica bacterium]|nr:FAD-dependent thymidylate synthase [Candidatus Omnitrophota bacterium]